MSREEIINLSNNIRTGKDYETLLNYFKGLNERISPQKHTIVFSLPSFTGTGYFRVSEPLFSIFRATDEFNLVYTDKIMPIHINIADLLVLHRAGDMHDLTHSIINAYPSHKIKPLIIHNVDDDESNLAKSHNMRDMWLHAGRDKQAVRAMRMSDAVEITGRRLKQIASQRNKNSFITPNYFNWRNPQWNMPKKKNLSESFPETDRLEHFTIPSEWQNKCVVGWAGLTSHYEDLKKIAPILKAIHDKYPNTVFAICGMALKDTSFRIEVDPKTGEKTTVEETNVPKESTYRYRVSKLFEGIAEDRIKIFDALHLENYAWFYSIMDIGIVLVEHNIFNQAKCIVSDSLVPTNKGILRIQNIKDDFNGLKTSEDKDIVANISYEKEECVKIETKCGYLLEGTKSHRVRDINNEWKNLDSLNIGNSVKIAPFEFKQKEYQKMEFPMLLNKFNNTNVEDGVEIDYSKINKNNLPSLTITEDWGEFIGFIVGDGHMDINGGFGISCNSRDADEVEYISKLIDSLGMKHSITKHWDRECVLVRTCSKNLLRMFYKYGITKTSASLRNMKKVYEVPDIILQSPKSVIRGFLRGLFESDATVDKTGNRITFSTKSEKLARQVQFCLLGFGIKSIVSFDKVKLKTWTEGRKYYYVEMAKKSTHLFKNEIGFISKFKKDRINTNDGSKRSNNHDDWEWNDEIVSKEYSINDVYDIEVDEVHEYNSNGFVSHNSSIKYNESIMYNVPTVCSYFGGYTDTFDILKQEATIDKDVLNKMICKTECDKSEWVKNLSYFVENYNNEDVKEKIQTIKSFIQDYYDIDLHVHEKIGKYKNMIEENIDKYQYYHMKLKTL